MRVVRVPNPTIQQRERCVGMVLAGLVYNSGGGWVR